MWKREIGKGPENKSNSLGAIGMRSYGRVFICGCQIVDAVVGKGGVMCKHSRHKSSKYLLLETYKTND